VGWHDVGTAAILNDIGLLSNRDGLREGVDEMKNMRYLFARENSTSVVGLGAAIGVANGRTRLLF
jgi:hypothetical protein